MKKHLLSKLGVAFLSIFGITTSAYAAYPAAEDLAGTYNFAAGSYTNTLADNGFEYLVNYFPQDFQFVISVEDGIISINNLFFPGTLGTTNLQATYDQDDGTLTLNRYTVTLLKNTGFGNQIFGIAPNGEWGGISAASIIYPVLNVSEDGLISFPSTLDIITYSGANITNTFVKYGDISVTKVPEDDNIPGTTYNAIEGVWAFNVYDYSMPKSTANRTLSYGATYDNGTVTFTEITEYGDGDVMIATLDGDQLTFNRSMTTLATYPKYQVPFTTATTSTTEDTYPELPEQSFSATYDEANETITFTSGQGLKYGTFFLGTDIITNEYTGWTSGFMFTEPAKKTGDFEPVLNLNSPLGTYWTIGNGEVTVNYNITTSYFDPDQDYTWTANVTMAVGEQDQDPTQQPVSDVTTNVDLEAGTASITISGLSVQEYIFTINLTASVDGKTYATSNTRYLSIYVGPEIQIRNPQVEVDGLDATVTVQAWVLNNIPDNATYKLKFIPTELLVVGGDEEEPDQGTIDAATIYVDATVENIDGTNYASGMLTDLEPGTYDYRAYLVAYNADGDVIITSEGSDVLITVDDPDAPAIQISNVAITNIEAAGELYNYQVTFNAQMLNFDYSDVNAFEAVFEYGDASQGGAVKKEVVATIDELGVGYCNLIEMPAGLYTLDFYVTAYDEENNEIATSEYASVQVNTTATGIAGLNAAGLENGVYYNLKGVPVANPQGGIYIINGKKVVIR